MKSPFKVMSTAALAAAVAVPTLSVPAADAAETSSFQSVALETEDGSIVTVSFSAYAQAKTFGTGELGEFVESADVVAVSAEEGKFVTIRTLAMAKIENPDADTVSLLDELDESEDNLVADEDVADYTAWEDMGEDGEATVESASASNLKQIEVEFSGDVDATAAGTADYYSFETAAGTSVSVSDVDYKDGMAVLTLASALDNQTEGTLTVDSDVTGEETEFDLEFFDTTIPEVTDVSVAGKDTVKFSFSEPLAVEQNDNGKWVTIEDGEDVKDAFSIADGDYYIKSVDVVNNGTEINVVTYADLDEGDLDVSLDNSLEDYAGFNVVSTEQTLDVVLDGEAPEVVDYKNASPRQVTLVFNEDVQLTEDAEASDFYHTNDNNEADAVEVDGNEVTLTFNTDKLPEGTAYVYMSGDSIVDLWGNVLETQERVEVNVTVDETAPELEELKVTGDQSLELHMTEAVNVDDAELTLLDANGDEVEDGIDEVTVDSEDSSVVNVTTYEDLSGSYSLVVDGVEDLSGNSIDKVTENFFVDDNDVPSVTGDIAKLYDVNDDQLRLVVNYPEQMAVEGQYSIDDLSKYQLENVDLAGVDGASLDVTNDGSSVEIMLPKENISLDALEGEEEYTLEIGRVADDSGNYTGFTNTVTVSGEGVVELASFSNDAAKVWATDNETITVELTERLVDFDKNDFTFSNDSDADVEPAKVNTSLNSSGNTVITFTFEDGAITDGLVGNWQLTTAGDEDGSVNQYGEPLEDTTVAVQDYINPELAYDGDGNLVFEQTDETESEFTLTFTEAIKTTAGTDLTASDLVIYNEDNEKLVPGSDYSVSVSDQGSPDVASDDNQLTVNLTSDYVGELEISTASEVNYLSDLPGNALSAFDIEVSLEDVVSPESAAGIETTDTTVSGTAEAGTTVKVVADGGAADDDAVATASVDSEGNFEVTGLTADTAYELYVIDNAGNASTGTGFTTDVAAQ